jgi:hypothetical protein
MNSLELLRSTARAAEQEELASRVNALRCYIEEAKSRFRIG